MNQELNKPDLLFRMMEQPQRYTADEWQAILADDECRELYTLMSKTRSAFDAVRADETVTDEAMEAEWKRLENEKITHHPSSITHHSSFHKIAATFIGILLVSGISLAAIQLWKADSDASEKKEEVAQTADTTIVAEQTTVGEKSEAAHIIYDNVSLEKMLSEIAAHYGAEVVFQSDSVRQLRFHFVWKPDDGLSHAIEKLNRFESLSARLEDHQIIVE